MVCFDREEGVMGVIWVSGLNGDEWMGGGNDEKVFVLA